MPSKKKKTGPLRILVVDDEDALRAMYVTWLAAEGYQTLEAENGVAAVEKAFHELPDLVLLDILLPKKDGFQVLTEIRRNPKTKAMPVIILSSLDKDFEQKQGLNLGAEKYLVKTTITPESLYQTISDELK